MYTKGIDKGVQVDACGLGTVSGERLPQGGSSDAQRGEQPQVFAVFTAAPDTGQQEQGKNEDKSDQRPRQPKADEAAFLCSRQILFFAFASLCSKVVLTYLYFERGFSAGSTLRADLFLQSRLTSYRYQWSME
ncbi:hypothetical protein Nmel_005750 [Mimus melanotis]